jgi:nucleoside-diphosphate-sugar epimerase
MIALVTGSSGQDGRLLIPILVNSGYDVICVSKAEITKVGPSGNTRIGINPQLENQDFCNHLLNKYKPKIIFHLAAVHGSRESEKNLSRIYFELMRRCHVQITENFLDWMKRVNFSPKLIYPLSSQMYLAQDYPTVVDETKIPVPVNLYAKTKFEAWKLIQRERLVNELDVSCAILFTHTSIYAKDEFLLPSLARKLRTAAQEKFPKIKLIDAVTPISICSATEVVSAIHQLSMLDYSTDVVIGDSDLKTTTQIIMEFIQRRSDLGISEIEITSGTSVVKPYLSPITWKAQRVLGWNPQINPVDILIDIFEYQKSTFTRS